MIVKQYTLTPWQVGRGDGDLFVKLKGAPELGESNFTIV
jgi:hypothetical protein